MKKMLLSFIMAVLATSLVNAQEEPQPPQEPDIQQTEVKNTKAQKKGKKSKEKVSYAPAGQLGCKAGSLASLTIIKGKPVKKISPKKVYVVEFWATWCGPCVAMFPHLTELQKAYPHVTIIGITTYGTVGEITQFVNKQGDRMNYTVALDSTKAVYDAYGIPFQQRGIPHAYLVKEGKVIWQGHPQGLDAQLKTHASK